MIIKIRYLNCFHVVRAQISTSPVLKPLHILLRGYTTKIFYNPIDRVPYYECKTKYMIEPSEQLIK